MPWLPVCLTWHRSSGLVGRGGPVVGRILPWVAPRHVLAPVSSRRVALVAGLRGAVGGGHVWLLVDIHPLSSSLWRRHTLREIMRTTIKVWI